MDKTVENLYKKFRAAGCTACHALYSAKTVSEFAELEAAGLVKLYADEEEESYFDVYGTPDSKEELQKQLDMLNRYGNYCVVSEFWNPVTQEFEFADSIGHCAGYKNPCDPFENDYVVGLMRNAVRDYKNSFDKMIAAV